ncbi:MAG: 3'-5' exonuclease [Colwellia sp.]|nr:3'-5' exonuclease [Colwellia sp.]
MHENANSLVVLDFETTGLSPNNGDRAIEIGAVRIENGQVTDKFQSLMTPGFRINNFIERYTGISNQMLAKAEPCEEVMQRFADFIGDDNLLAHNASFDKKFLDAELNSISRTYSGQFICSLLVSRRINIAAPNHKLGTLISYKNIPADGAFHRALYDAEMTAKLWLTMLDDLSERISHEFVPFKLIQKLSKTPKNDINKLLAKW